VEGSSEDDNNLRKGRSGLLKRHCKIALVRALPNLESVTRNNLV